MRPTGDRMKASIFSAIGSEIAGASVVDLFAGSGALGLEALSRGAQTVTFVDNNVRNLALLKENIAALDAENSCRAVRADVFSFLHEHEKGGTWDFAFCDPPFVSGDCDKILSLWLDNRLPARVLMLEHPARNSLNRQDDADSYLAKRADFGESRYSIFVREL